MALGGIPANINSGHLQEVRIFVRFIFPLTFLCLQMLHNVDIWILE